MAKHLLMGPELGNGVRGGVMFDENGSREPVVFSDKDSVPPGVDTTTYQIEPCHEAGDDHSVVHVFEANETGHKGPARANSESYRCGYDRIFGKTVEDRETDPNLN